MRAVIVAAGQGTRLRGKGGLKPLIPLRGMPLIEHVIARIRAAGIDDVLVVSGYRGEELRRELDAIAERLAVRIGHVVNPDWSRANGVSLLAARPHLDGPFLLAMCDHLIDPGLLRDLISAPCGPDTVTLAVDNNIDDPLNDPADITRVQHARGRIERIGKSIAEFNAIDTGAFLCTPVMFAALEASQAHGDDSISGAMTVLAAWGQAFVFDAGHRVWLDVDDPAGFEKAERLLDDGRL